MKKDMKEKIKQLKLESLKELMSLMDEEMMSDEMPEQEEAQKVTVMAKDKEGLMKGLEKAEDILEQNDMSVEDEEEEDEE